MPTYVEYPSEGGTSGEMRGYLVRPAGDGPFPTVLVIHENRGLNPYIEDVARRFAVAGFLALAPDGFYPVGGYPGNDDDGRELQRSLDQTKLKRDMLNSARFVQGHEDSTGRLGAVGFCWGGGTVNHLAVEMGDDFAAGVPFYGAAPASEDVANISAPLLIQAAENDDRINATWPEFEAALRENGVTHERHLYPGTGHGFHNNSTPRFDEAAAALAPVIATVVDERGAPIVDAVVEREDDLPLVGTSAVPRLEPGSPTRPARPPFPRDAIRHRRTAQRADSAAGADFESGAAVAGVEPTTVTASNTPAAIAVRGAPGTVGGTAATDSVEGPGRERTGGRSSGDVRKSSIIEGR